MSSADSAIDTIHSAPFYEPGPERFFLVGVSGVATGLEFALEKPQTLIGRSTSCDICLSDEGVSRRHVSLTLMPDPVRPGRSYVLLEDLGSRNGVRVSGYLVGSTLLEGGEKLLVGDSVLRVERRDALDSAHHDRQRAMLRVDPLTTLGNRQALQEAHERCESMRASQGRAYSVLLVDIDHFKGVNDTYGHAAGDHALRRIAEGVRGCLRGTDSAFRLGGDEFMVILGDTGPVEARRVADRIRATVEATPVHHAGRTFGLTVSVGLAPGGPGTVEEADLGLYEAKRSGRNAVHAAEYFQAH